MFSKRAAMRRFFFGGAALGALATAISPALAQQPPAGPQPAPEQTQPATGPVEGRDVVVITGSRIARSPESAPTPVIQIDQDEIKTSGEQNIVDYLADLPALQNSQVYEDTTGGFVGIGGLAFLNLRNLGSGRTLVLVDGRRHIAGDPAGARVDVDTIPTPLVERVEIVTGGASATYGADAVSGVVNFIMKDDFEGLNLDLSTGQLTQGEYLTNNRASITWGTNFMEGRGNIYAFAEYQQSDAVFDKDLDIDFLRDDQRFIITDADPANALSDNVLDNMPISGLRSLNRPLGGILVLANAVTPSPAADPDIPIGACTVANANTAAFQANCFSTNPGTAYQFRPDGTPFLADFGSGRNTGALNRVTTIGGSGDKLTVVETNRLPEQTASRFQVGGNYDITDNINLFGEVKYVEEQNIDIFQPHFANIGIRTFNTGAANYNYAGDLAYTALTSFNIGLDNAYLPASLRTAIQTNQRTSVNADGTSPAGTVLDARAQLRVFSYDLGYRPSIADRDTTRVVAGLRGSMDNFFFVNDVNWEVSGTWGEMNALGNEALSIDVERYAFAADAVVDTAGELGTPGAVVCRAQLLVRRGVPVRNALTGAAYTANSPQVRDCRPIRLFGTGGFSQEAQNYILTQIITKERNEQRDVTAYATGSLWDLWGAGPIGAAIGAEGRKEITEADLTSFGDRVLFGNSGGDLAETSFDVVEFFAEVDIPIIRDLPFVRELNLSGAARTSNYSSIGVTDTWSAALRWQVTDDFALRATKGISVRAPTMGELFSPPFDTFPSLTDNCSQPIINGTADARIRANRVRNCAQIGVPTTYVDPAPTVSNTGKSGSNPLLQPEESDSFTMSAIYTPSYLPGFSFVADYYDIRIDNAIVTLSAQTLLNLCTDSDAFNAQACGVFTRAPSNASNAFEIINFIEGPFNFAGLVAKGIDFESRYGFETAALFGVDIGRIDLGLTGNYLIRRQDFTNPANPNLPTNIDASPNDPRVRVRASATWSNGPLALSYRLDFQEAQEIINDRALGANTDTRDPAYFTTGDFFQHDIAVKYQLTEGVELRGGITNVFDNEPKVQTFLPTLTTDAAGLMDSYDLFGRRFFAGINVAF